MPCDTSDRTASATHVVDLERKRSGHNLRLYGLTAEQYEALRVQLLRAAADYLER